MENTEISNNENETINTSTMENQNEIHVDSSDNKPIEPNTMNNESVAENAQKPPIVEEKKETPIVNNTISSNNVSPIENTQNLVNETKETIPTVSEPITTLPEQKNVEPEVATATPQKTPELTSRKSFKNLSKEEKIRRQRELRKKKILASSQERLSRITKTYSQSSNYYDSSDKDDTSLSRKSSSRSIHHHYSIDRVSSNNSINKDTTNIAQTTESDKSQITNEQQNSNINNISRNSSINSINSLRNVSEIITRETNDNNNLGNIENNGIPSATADNNNTNISESNTDVNVDSDTNAIDTNSNDFARLLFRKMLEEEFNKTDDQYGQNARASPFSNNNLNGHLDFKNGMDTLLTADKPFEALGKMFDFLNVDEKANEEQRIADEKYKQYCKFSKLIHTAIITLYSLVVVLISIRAVHVIDNHETSKRNFIGNFFYRLSNSDTLSQGKTILGMTPWTCLVLLEFSLLAGQLGYQYAFNIKKEGWKEFDLIAIPIVNKFISLIYQYKLFIEILINDLFLYLFIIGFSLSVGKIFY
jgi:hypothetical protein